MLVTCVAGAQHPGCRGVIGPVPMPLWIRVKLCSCQSSSILGVTRSLVKTALPRLHGREPSLTSCVSDGYNLATDWQGFSTRAALRLTVDPRGLHCAYLCEQA